MAWRSIPTIFRRAGGLASHGFLQGIGADAGFYCIDKRVSDIDPPTWIVTDCLDAVVTIGTVRFEVAGYLYGGHPVWTPPGLSVDGPFVFRSRSKGWIRMDELREPVLWPLLDGETEADRVGDAWLALSGFSPRTDCSGTAFAQGLEQADTIWTQTIGKEYFHIADPGSTGDDFFGKYVSADGDYRFVGLPTFGFYASSGLPADFVGEKFTLAEGSPPAPSDEREFVGSRGHTLKYDNALQRWIIGAVQSTAWLEGESLPEIGTDDKAPFHVFGVNQTGQTVLLAYAGAAKDASREKIFVSEVELWR